MNAGSIAEDCTAGSEGEDVGLDAGNGVGETGIIVHGLFACCGGVNMRTPTRDLDRSPISAELAADDADTSKLASPRSSGLNGTGMDVGVCRIPGGAPPGGGGGGRIVSWTISGVRSNRIVSWTTSGVRSKVTEGDRNCGRAGGVFGTGT